MKAASARKIVLFIVSLLNLNDHMVPKVGDAVGTVELATGEEQQDAKEHDDVEFEYFPDSRPDAAP